MKTFLCSCSIPKCCFAFQHSKNSRNICSTSWPANGIWCWIRRWTGVVTQAVPDPTHRWHRPAVPNPWCHGALSPLPVPSPCPHSLSPLTGAVHLLPSEADVEGVGWVSPAGQFDAELGRGDAAQLPGSLAEVGILRGTDLPCPTQRQKSTSSLTKQQLS